MHRMHPKSHYAALAKVRAADAAHTEVMERICARGGLSLELLRSMKMREKDAFITQYRDRPENMKVAAE
jgi:hypothetical protein